MIRGQTHMAVAVRRPNGAIATQLRPLSTLYTGTLRRLPLVRGVITLVETLSLGMRALSYSSSVSLEDPEADPDSEVESEELSKGALASMLLVSFGFAILLFFLLPLFASRPLEGAFGNDILSNVAEGAIRLAVFVAYIWVIGRMPEIRRVFMYHGAEHMTVHAQERGDPLVTEAIRKYSPAHPTMRDGVPADGHGVGDTGVRVRSEGAAVVAGGIADRVHSADRGCRLRGDPI